MKKPLIERAIVAILFLAVLIVFSFAERDTEKLDALYKTKAASIELIKTKQNLAISEQEQKIMAVTPLSNN